MELELVLRRAVELGASDIHLKIERPPIVRRDGNLGELEGEPELTERDLELALEQVCAATPKRLQTFLETGELDSAFHASASTASASAARSRSLFASSPARSRTSTSSPCLLASGAWRRSTAG